MCVSHAGLSKTQLPLYNEKDAILSEIIGKNSVFIFYAHYKKETTSFVANAYKTNNHLITSLIGTDAQCCINLNYRNSSITDN